MSKSLNSAERNYAIYDRELLAIIAALTEWRYYLQGATMPVEILTDHLNLLYFKDPQKLTHRQACWQLFLQDFNI